MYTNVVDYEHGRVITGTLPNIYGSLHTVLIGVMFVDD